MIPLRDHNRPRTPPLLTYALIAANVAVFMYQLQLGLTSKAGEAFVFQYGVVPYLLTQDLHLASLSTPFTSLFMHGSLMHIASNMWFLHVFGDNVEDALGRARFALLYVATGLLAVVAQVLVDPESRIPMIGASGAIAGVLGAYLRLFPSARIVTLIPILFFFIVRDLPAVFFNVIWFGFQLLSGLGSLGMNSGEGGVAFFAHIGGFLAGLWLLGVLGVRRNRTAGFRVSRERFDYR